MGEAETERLRTAIGEALATYGVEVVRVVLTHVDAADGVRRVARVPPAGGGPAGRGGGAARARESLRQSDVEELDRQRISARREAIELEAANEVARLERLEKRIREYPNAMRGTSRASGSTSPRPLPANTRAMVQVGPGGDVAASLLMHTLPDDGGQAKPAAGPAPAPADGASRSARASRPKREAS